ncbi:restriction endonuclease subunit S [Micromonospora sp. AMSO12t]|uniref:restriction endonuclease subunit S n=1 Tax=Micromonospora sp. AMSO12t TaxID=2650410 RepID=UPI00124B4908|nr:restriction endonuclease subunit S [Micromonospora sp. AMSO12t]KAB1156361.1 restriction endonuclease subunit S [Micromonospora sp. AMSO12t]
MSDWPTVRFEDLAAPEKSAISKPYGSAFTAKDYVDSGVPMVRGVNLGTGRFVDDGFVYISDSKANQIPGANLRGGDLVFTHRGIIGQVAMVPRSPRFPRYVLSTSQVKARLDPSLALSDFYLYWFLSPAGQRALLSGISTVGVPGLAQPVATIKAIQVPHPPLAVQRAITDVLGALNDKIAVNDRIVATCLELMRSHYEKAISAGSHDVVLGELATFANKQRVPLSSQERNARPGPYPYYGAAGVVGYVDNFLFEGARLLVGEDGSVITPEGRPVTQYVWGKFWVNNHAHVLTGTTISTELLSIALHFTSVGPLVTGAVQPKLSMSNLRRLEVPIPSTEILAELEPTSAGVYQRIRSASTETRHLVKLRDTLLPELMSERLRVKDVEKVVEEAV